MNRFDPETIRRIAEIVNNVKALDLTTWANKKVISPASTWKTPEGDPFAPPPRQFSFNSSPQQDQTKVQSMGLKAMFAQGISVENDYGRHNQAKTVPFEPPATPFDVDTSKWDLSQVKTVPFEPPPTPFDVDTSKWDLTQVKPIPNPDLPPPAPFTGDISDWKM